MGMNRSQWSAFLQVRAGAGEGTLERPGLGTEAQELLAGGRGGVCVARPKGGARPVAGMELGTTEESGIVGG